MIAVNMFSNALSAQTLQPSFHHLLRSFFRIMHILSMFLDTNFGLAKCRYLTLAFQDCVSCYQHRCLCELFQAAWIRSAVEAMEAQNLEWGEECNYVHDVLPVGFFLEPSMFETQPGRLVVDATGETPGRSVLVNTSERAKYAVKVNQSLFDHFVVDVGRYFRTRVRLQQHRDL